MSAQTVDEALKPWHDVCDAVGIPYDPEGLVRHHRGNAGMAAALDAMTNFALKMTSSSVVTAAAQEAAKHISYYQTRYDGKGGVKWQDDGGLHCTCDWSVPPDDRGFRPWNLWHEHVQEAALAAAVRAAF